jgi:TolA-binding protein
MKLQAEGINRNLFDERFSKIDDSILVAEVKDYIRAQFDLDEIMNDPSLEKIRSESSKIVNSRKEMSKSESNKNFVSNALSNAPGQKINDDIKDIQLDLSKTSIDNISAEWVDDWHRRKQQGTVSKERMNFISGALEANESDESMESVSLNETVESTSLTGKKTGRVRILRFISLSAAAIFGAALLFKSLHPVNPQKLFSSYYEPFIAVSPVVRGINSNDLYISGINSYKAGDYKNAELAFEQSANTNPSMGSPVFFLGLTALETGDYNEAIKDLNSVIKEAGAYSKEAEWYLGLAYLKTGNKEKARECFEELSNTSGYYKERSEKILRHLR